MRIVLPVAVHGGDDGKFRGPDPGRKCRTLARAGAMAEIAQRAMSREQRFDLRGRAVVAAVVDHDHFAEHVARHRAIGLFHQAPDIPRLVKGRNYNGNTHHCLPRDNRASLPISSKLSSRRTTLYTGQPQPLKSSR